MAVFTITADSVPIYSTSETPDAWECGEWMRFRTALATKYTPEEADYLWSKYWLDGVSRFSGGTGLAPGSGYVTDSVPLSCRTFDNNFKAFLDQYPNLKSAVFSGVGGLIAKPISLGTSLVDAAGNLISNVAKGASNFGSTLKWLIPTVLIIGAIFAVIYFGRKAGVKLA